MSGALPNWIEHLLGVEAAGSGEGTAWALDNSWSWAPWATLLFLGLTAAFVAWAYFSETGSAGRAARIAMAVIRVGVVGLVMLMLAEWILSLKRTGLPSVVVIVDDSGSMGTPDRYDDPKVQTALAKLVKQAGLSDLTRLSLAKSLLLRDDADLLRQIEERYKLKVYLLSETELAGENVGELAREIKNLKASAGSSRLGERVRSVLNDSRGNPPAAIILLSDGITTEGETLVDVAAYAGRKGVPLFTVGIGDDQPLHDLKLDDLVVDEVVFAGDVVSFEGTVSATGFEGKSVKLTLREDGKPQVLAETTVKLGADSQPQKVILPYRPKTSGDFENVDFDYVVELETLPQETQTDNNRQKRRVRISNRKISVLLAQAYPSFEFRYLKQMLQRDETIELHAVLQEADAQYAEFDKEKTAQPVFPVRREELFKYDVIIFGDVNPAYLSASAIQHLSDFVTERGGSIIFIAGPLYTPMAYRGTPLASLMPMDLSTVTLPDPGLPIDEGFVARPTPLGLTSPQMQIGDSLSDTAEKWDRLPELYWFLEAPDLKPAVRVLAEHPTKAGNGQNLPLISMQYVGPGKVVFHATDDTWRWRYRVGDVLFARYWVQTIRYLSRSKFGREGSAELTADRRVYTRGDSVQLRVRFFDEQLAPAKDDGVAVMVERPGTKKEQVNLHRATSARGVFEGTLPSIADGKYHVWVIEPSTAAEASIDFEVQAPAGELERLQMDVAELKRAAQDSKGRFYPISAADDLLHDLPPGHQVPIESLPPEVLWNKWPVLLLFLGLLSTEWVLRKRKGMM